MAHGTVTKESVVYNGYTYTRWPDSPNWADRVYYRRGGGCGYLHRDIYRAHHGPIPEGMVVHHKDHNPLNNDPANLALAHLPEHTAYHSLERFADSEYRAVALEHLERIRPLTVAWHRSEEGREWHRQHGIEAYAKREPQRFTCEQCGAEYESLNRGKGTRFCSNKCSSAWRRASGLDDVDRNCAACGESFRVNKYSKQRCCSRVCSQQLRSTTRKAAGVQPHG